MDASIALQFFLNGLFLSSVYALVALGLTLIFGVADIADFSQGALYMVGAYAALELIQRLGLGQVSGLIVAMAFVAVLGAVNYLLAYRPLLRIKGPNTFIAALGILVVLENTVLLIAGPDEHYLAPPLGDGSLRLAGAALTYQRAFLIGMTAVFIAAVWLFLTRTRSGKALRAVSQNRMAAELCGINRHRVLLYAFLVAAGLAGGAGALMAPIIPITPHMGGTIIVKSFAIVIVGGMGSAPGALLGALLIGMGETISTAYMPSLVTNLIAFVLMVTVLLFRPHGLLGQPE
jgi:branched-chain amino acid transport system permease protein